jgi:hypothetical protein
MNSVDTNETSCAFWETPVSSLETLWLSNQLHTGSYLEDLVIQYLKKDASE